MTSETLSIETRAFKNTQKIEHKFSVIWLHGLGADRYDFVPMAQSLEKIIDLPLRFIFPSAPLRAVTLNNSLVMPAWYDITGLDLHAREDREGLENTSQVIYSLIQNEIEEGILVDHIFLGGFSQGGASVLYAGLRFPKKLAGIIAFSAYLPFYKFISQESHDANQTTPIFWAHGSEDTIVLPTQGKVCVRALKSAGYNVELKNYMMAHQVCDQELIDLANWMKHIAVFSNEPIITKSPQV